MSKITEEEIKKILPVKGPSFEEVKDYLEKYSGEYIVIKYWYPLIFLVFVIDLDVYYKILYLLFIYLITIKGEI